MKRLFNFLFNRWTKWEVYQKDHPFTVTTMSNPLQGPQHPIHVATFVMHDIYVKTNKYTGIKKYKNVRKY